jgi:hypothetical protein
MSECVITKGQDGKLAGFGKKGVQDYDRWKRAVAALQPGELLHFSWREPRSPRHHRWFFALLGGLLERQEQFDTLDKLRMWLTVGAGHCDFVPGASGRMVALPRSIAFDKMDQAEFAAFNDEVQKFLRGEHAARFLWPQLTQAQQIEAVESLLAEFSGEATPA